MKIGNFSFSSHTLWAPAGYNLVSCIGAGQALRTDTGWLEVQDLQRKHTAGRRIVLLVDGRPSPVVLALATMARGYRIDLTDGRAVTLTGGHVLPESEATYRTSCGRGPTATTIDLVVQTNRVVNAPVPMGPVREQRAETERTEERAAAHWDWLRSVSTSANENPSRQSWGALLHEPTWRHEHRPIATGDSIDGSTVAAVTDLGHIVAVRIGCADYGWLECRSSRSSRAPVRVGQRWHETGAIHARGDVDENGDFTPSSITMGHLVVNPTFDLNALRERHWRSFAPTDQLCLLEPYHGWATARDARATQVGQHLPEIGERPCRLVRGARHRTSRQVDAGVERILLAI